MSRDRHPSGRVTAEGGRVVRDPAICTVCSQGPDLATGALIRLPGTYRWVHRTCLSSARRVAHVKQRRLAPEAR
jgi:hypothetical protein